MWHASGTTCKFGCSANTRPSIILRVPGKNIQINLGSGNEPKQGFVNLDRRRIPGIQLQGDVTALPFADGSCSHVWASSVLEHFEDPYSVLKEIHRVLTRDGAVNLRMPSPWSMAGHLDKTHVFLADLKLWRQILGGYFVQVEVTAEGVRYRDNKLLTALQYIAIRGLGMKEFCQTWEFKCSGKLDKTRIAYVPWWLEEKYGK